MSGDSNASTNARRDAGFGSADEPRAVEALRDSVAALNDLLVFHQLDDHEMHSLAEDIRSLTADLATGDGSQASTAAESSTSESWGDYRRRSPFAGIANPRSPGLRMRIDRDADLPTAHGIVTVGAAFAGPPGFVHGGMIAGLLDEAIGWLASATMPDAAVVTGKLAVRFRAPTPVNEPLDLDVTVTRQTSRSMTITAEVRAGDALTATSEALMVVRR